MEKLVSTAPAVTLGEVLFLGVALALILFIPLATAWANAGAARAVGRSRVELGSPLTAPEPVAQVDERPALDEASELNWPVGPPPSSLDPWHPEEEGNWLERISAFSSASEATDRAASGYLLDQPRQQLVHPPPLGAISEWSAPAGRYGSLPTVFVSASEKTNAQLESLRQVSLATWPGPMAAWSPEVREAWERGLELYRSWKSAVLNLPLRLPPQSESYALARVETDGSTYRFHFLVFDQLWPTHSDEALAVCIVDLDPGRGPLSWCVVPPLVIT